MALAVTMQAGKVQAVCFSFPYFEVGGELGKRYLVLVFSLFFVFFSLLSFWKQNGLAFFELVSFFATVFLS